MPLPIKQERTKRGWTQQYVATQVGLTRTAIHDIENGLQAPSYKVLVKLENLFGMTHRELLRPPLHGGG
ncbi:MAG: helix-turn-helix domain-containing protein [Clostridiales Family XIII bacterium]|jgi:transcriptional regulator with XRE-family HTH domain|nr:helix-turn-helix domain-containing protein [Clostridiales Family XIII bacterium]